MQQDKLNYCNLELLFSETDQFTHNLELLLKYQQAPENQTNIPIQELKCHEKYYILFRIKLKQGIDEKEVEKEFQSICKSLYILSTSFSHKIKSFLKPRFSLTYQVIQGFAYINVQFTDPEEVKDFLFWINKLSNRKENLQKKEYLNVNVASDAIVNEIAVNLKKLSDLQYRVKVQGELQTEIVQILEALDLVFDKKHVLEKMVKKSKHYNLILQMLQSINCYAQFGKVDLFCLKHTDYKLKLPFRLNIYKKIQGFCNNYVDQQIEFHLRSQDLNLEIQLNYIGELFSLMENLVQLKQ